MKNKCLLFLIVFISFGCSPASEEYNSYEGEVFGTYFRFKIDSDKDYSGEIDSVFNAVDAAINRYSETSEISSLNTNGQLKNPSPVFLEILSRAKESYDMTNGYFNPVHFLERKKFEKKNISNFFQDDSLKVSHPKNALPFYEFLTISKEQIEIAPGVKLDLDGLGEGFTLEAISSILQKDGVENHLLEIGGEINCKGINQKGKVWTVGIETPSLEDNLTSRKLSTTVPLSNEAISTSGSYRKFIEIDGKKESHIINPKTGMPIRHQLLSASIISKSSLKADVISTASMAMGLEKALKYIEENKIKAHLIYARKGELQSWYSTNW